MGWKGDVAGRVGTNPLKPVVVGTSAQVYPAAGYIDQARHKGARVCVVNMDTNDAPASGWRDGDWLFQGDAATIVPKLLEPISVGGNKSGWAKVALAACQIGTSIDCSRLS